MNKYNYNKLTPFKWFILENFPLIDEDFDALTNWQLFCKLGKEMNKIINSQNNVGAQMETVTDAFIALQDYVTNYFDNLDVQDEIDNKLDDMVEQGTLQEIITEYLNSRAVFGFDSVEAMADSINLIDGSYARTYGFYNNNDGGGALYKIREITNNDVVNGITIIALVNDNSLVAELITEDSMPIECFGVTGSDEDDDSDYTNIALETNVKELIFNNTYTLKGLKLNNNITIKGNGTINVLHGLGGNSDSYLAINKNNITIDGLTFNMRTSAKLYFKTCDNVVIKNCKINSYSGGWNIKLQYCNNSYVTNNIIITDGRAYDDGIHVTGENIYITENFIKNSDDITVAGGDDSIVVGSETIEEDLTKTVKNIIISNNTCRTTSRAINLYSHNQHISNIFISNNHCEGRMRISCETTQTQKLFNNIKIDNCDFINQNSAADYVCMINCAENINIANCSFDTPIKNLVTLQKYYENIEFNNCTFTNKNYTTSNPGDYAVFKVDADTTNASQKSVIIKNCYIYTATKLFINLANEITIKNNVIYSTLASGALMSIYDNMPLSNFYLSDNNIFNPNTNYTETRTITSINTHNASASFIISNNIHNFGTSPYYSGGTVTKTIQNDKAVLITIPS